MSSGMVAQRSGDGKLAWLEAGSGRPIVLLHGVGLAAVVWRPQLEVLGKARRVIALDLPGHGGTAHLQRGATLDDFVTWACAAITTAAGTRQVDLIGHSFGAMVALGIALEPALEIGRLVLIAPVYRRDPVAAQAVAERAHRLASGDRQVEVTLSRWFGDPPAFAAERALVRQLLEMVDLAGYATAYAVFAAGDAVYRDRLGYLRAPLLAVAGALDPNATPAMAAALAASVPHGETAVVAGHRHMLPLTAPEQTNELLMRWLIAEDARVG